LRVYSALKSTLYPWLKGKGEVKVDFSYPYPTLTLTLVGTLRVYPTYLWWAKAQNEISNVRGAHITRENPIPFNLDQIPVPVVFILSAGHLLQLYLISRAKNPFFNGFNFCPVDERASADM